MLLRFFYEVALWSLLLVSAPKMLFQLFCQGKYRSNLLRRFGRDIPHVVKQGRPLIWIHAVSLGETRAVLTLARRIKEELRNPYLIISSVTETGHAEAKRIMPFADQHLYLPFDSYFVMRGVFQRIQPDLVIVTESDFWYNFLTMARQCGAQVVLANGKISARSADRFRRSGIFGRRLFDLFNLICVQNSDYADLFLQAGASPQRIHVTGNLKFDETPIPLSSDELERWRRELGIDPSQPVITVGSTHDPEEKKILKVFEKIWEKVPNCQLIMAPRHPDRFPEVAQILEDAGISYCSYTQRKEGAGRARVVLIDTMGLLRCCYQLADIAVVAGSYTAKVGGHNILEPCLYGIPVLFGPHMKAQSELRHLVLEHHAGLEVDATALAPEILALLEDRNRRHDMGRAGRQLMQTNAGATKRTWDLITQFAFHKR